MKKVKHHYHHFFSDKSLMISFILSVVFLLVSLVINYLANQYAYRSQGNSVTDILLDNLPVVNMDDVFLFGTLIFLIFVIILLLARPHKMSFVVMSISLFVVVRSIFLTLTHIGPSPLNTLSSPSEIGQAFTSGADLFFSGHTGLPFLFALIFWDNKKLRYIFLAISIFAAVGVLLGHIHYSIDVASAYFITYGVYILSLKYFKKTHEHFRRVYNHP